MSSCPWSCDALQPITLLLQEAAVSHGATYFSRLFSDFGVLRKILFPRDFKYYYYNNITTTNTTTASSSSSFSRDKTPLPGQQAVDIPESISALILTVFISGMSGDGKVKSTYKLV